MPRRAVYQTDLEHYRTKAKEYWHRLREQMLDAYGRSCACCGEDNPLFLSLDHVNGGGAAERRSLGKKDESRKVWVSLRQRGWPKEGYQILCHNCNFAQGHYGKCH